MSCFLACLDGCECSPYVKLAAVDLEAKVRSIPCTHDALCLSYIGGGEVCFHYEEVLNAEEILFGKLISPRLTAETEEVYCLLSVNFSFLCDCGLAYQSMACAVLNTSVGIVKVDNGNCGIRGVTLTYVYGILSSYPRCCLTVGCKRSYLNGIVGVPSKTVDGYLPRLTLVTLSPLVGNSEIVLVAILKVCILNISVLCDNVTVLIKCGSLKSYAILCNEVLCKA